MPAQIGQIRQAFRGAALALLLLPATAGAATINVDPIADEINGDADCSLREAVQSANVNVANATGCEDGEIGPATDTIVLAPGGSYSNSIPADGTPDDNQDGDLDVLTQAGGPVAIQGGTVATKATIGAGGVGRAIDKLSGGELTLSGVLITDGDLDNPLEPGGGIRTTGGLLTVVDSTIFDNHTDQASGGGISALGDLTLENTIVAENTAGDSGGGASVSGALTINGSVIGNNDAGLEPGASAQKGGGVRTSGDAVTITDSTFDENGVAGTNAAGGGLAMSLSMAGSKTISGSTFTANDAGQQGGGIHADFNSDTAGLTIADSRIEGNDAGPGPENSVSGGGIYLGQVDLTLQRSVLRGNDASDDSPGGGGIAIDDAGSAMVDDSAIVDNHATATASSARGGGILTDGSLFLRRTTIASNTVDGIAAGDRGGGLFAGPNSAGVNAFNVTVHGNLALDAGAHGGGIHVAGAGSFVNLASSTVASNFGGGPAEPGDALSESQAGPLITARNSIIEGPVTDQVCDGDIDGAGYNVAEGTSCNLTNTGDEQNADSMLAPLEDNGGIVIGPPGDTEVVQTRALPKGSTAVDHVPAADFPNPSCTGQTSASLATDARAFPRPPDEPCDAGSYQLTKCFGQVVDDGAIVGTEDDDALVGTPAADLIFPLAGADVAKGAGGGDRICGTLGKDVLKGGKGRDKLDGGAEKDTCKGGKGKDKAKRCEKTSGVP